MSYNSTVPATGQTGAQNYQDMQRNYAQIQTSFSVNHKPLASGGATEGFHTQISIPAALGSDPNLTAPFSSVYVKAVSAINQLFFQNGNSSSNVAQLTGLPIVTVVAGSGTNYGVQTPWGLKLNWGVVSAATTSGVAVTYAIAFSSFQSVIVSPHNNTQPTSASTESESNTGFTAYSSRTNAVFYFAIGT